jgi:hypothetical protein
MKEEGFVKGSLQKVKENKVEARWLANQSLFNGNGTIQAAAKASVAMAINIYSEEHPEIHPYIEKAINVRTKQGMRKIIEEVDKIIN